MCAIKLKPKPLKKELPGMMLNRNPTGILQISFWETHERSTRTVTASAQLSKKKNGLKKHSTTQKKTFWWLLQDVTEKVRFQHGDEW